MRECMNQVEDLMKVKMGCIWINTYEEEQVVKDLKEIAWKMQGIQVHLWSHTQGLKTLTLSNVEKESAYNEKLANPKALFAYILAAQTDDVKNDNIFILRDLHLLNDMHELKRGLRDLKEYKSRNYNPIVVVSPVLNIPIEHEKLFTIIDYELPSKEDIKSIVDVIAKGIEKHVKQGKDYKIPTEAEKVQLTKACIGLTFNEIVNTLAKSSVKYKALSVQAVNDEKIQLVKKSGVLDYVIPQFSMDDIGGNKAFKQWVYEIQDSMSDEAKEFGIPYPKGFMGVGIPGGSKTCSAEAIADLLKQPLLSLNMSLVMSSLVGNSEKKIAQALRVAEACSPCVFLLDECEKLLGGISSSNSSDSGTLSRVAAAILGFMNRDNNVFVVMTSNDVSQLPPELTRAGRLDAQWYFGLPTLDERKEIFAIHFNKMNRKISSDLIAEAARVSNSYTGAEIKEVVKVAMRKSYSRFKKDGNREITEEDVISAAPEVIPISRSSREKIAMLEMYAQGRARNTNHIEDVLNDTSNDNDLVNAVLQIN